MTAPRAPEMPATVKGMLYMMTATSLSACTAAIVRHVSSDLPPFEIAFFRNLFGFCILLVMVTPYGLAPFRTKRFGLLATRAGLDLGSMLSYYTALSLTPLAKAVALFFTTPLIATVLAVAVLGERLKPRRIVALVAGFAGTWVILRPGVVDVGTGPLLVILAATLWAVAMMIIKTAARTESSLTQSLYMAMIATPVSLVAALPVWRGPDIDQIAWLALLGTLGGFGDWCVAQAFRKADATAVVPVDFMRLLFAAVIGYLAFAEIPDVWTWIGAAVIVGAVTAIALRERRAGSQ